MAVGSMCVCARTACFQENSSVHHKCSPLIPLTLEVATDLLIQVDTSPEPPTDWAFTLLEMMLLIKHIVAK